MNPRERTIAMAVLAAILLAGGSFFFYQLYLVPLGEREASVRAAQEALANQREQFEQAASKQAQLAQWRKLSLPSRDFSFCQREYGERLNWLITISGFQPGELDVKPSDATAVRTGPQLGQAETPYTPVNFTVSGHADLSKLVNLLYQFYSQPLLHKIKSLRISRPTGSTPKTRDLEFELRIEAIIVNGAENRPSLLPEKMASHVLAEPARDYSAIVGKNIFYGPPPPPQKPDDGPDPAASIRLISITTRNEGRHEVVLHDETHKPQPMSWWLYPEEEGNARKDIFVVKKGNDVRVQGEIVLVKGKDVFFRAGEKYHRIHLGETLEQALRRQLSVAELKELHLSPAPGKTSSR